MNTSLQASYLAHLLHPLHYFVWGVGH